MRALLLVGLAPALFAQSRPVNSVRDPWTELRASNPSGFEPSLQLTTPRPFHSGEVIRVDAVVPGSNPPPAPERWQFGGFLLDPPLECGEVQKPCFGFGGLMNGNEPAMQIGDRSGPSRLTLNRYVPLLPPGHYHAAILLRKLVLTNRSQASTTYGYPNPPQLAVTNTIELDLIPPSQEWTGRTIQAAIATLKTSDPQAYEARNTALEELRYLGASGAWRMASPYLPLDEGTLRQGLTAGNQAEWVCEVLQNRIPAPDQPVTASYLNTMERVCEEQHVPAPPPPAANNIRPAEARIGNFVASPYVVPQLSPEQQAYFDKLRSYREALLSKSTAALFASLPQKQPEPLADALGALLDQVQQARNSKPQQPEPEWAPGLAQAFARNVERLDLRKHYQLLNYFASSLRAPEMVPLLDAAMDAWKPGDYYEAPQTALSSLYAIDRPRAEARILKELLRPQTWLSGEQLKLLPASSVPPMDDELVAALAAAQKPGGWNAGLIMAAIGKYATPAAEPRIKAIYESQQQKCQPELMAYFVRVDPVYADQVFHRQPWDMHADPPPCADQYFQRTSPLAMAPPLERYMAAYLNHVQVRIKTVAAQMLGLYGSALAQQPLWEAFRYFHEYWKDQRSALPPSGEGAQLEVAFRNAIARSPNWSVSISDLHLIESLCISDQCVAETEQDLRAREHGH